MKMMTKYSAIRIKKRYISSITGHLRCTLKYLCMCVLPISFQWTVLKTKRIAQAKIVMQMIQN